MTRIFQTQEIGSVQRPIWRQKLDAPPSKEWMADAMLWGERLGVEERHELCNSQHSGLLQKEPSKRSPEDKKRIIDIATLYVIRMFEAAGLDRIYNGENPGTEMYDTVARRTNGISTAGTLNSFDANYFKKGIIDGKLSVKPDGIGFFVDETEFVSANTKRAVKPCLSGPYTMTDWSYIEYYRKSRESGGESPFEALKNSRKDALMEFSANVHNPIVKALAKNGVKVIQLDEPAATTKEYESGLFTEAINKSFEGIPADIEKAVHMCYSNYPVLFPSLADCVADTYLIEFTNHASPTSFNPTQVSPEAYKIIELFKEYKMNVNVGVGVVDIHSDLIETPQVIRDRLLYAAKLVGDPKRVQVNPDCGLRTRQWHVAFAKLLNMVEGAALARAEYGD